MRDGRERDKDKKCIMERKKECKGLRYDRNNSPLNFPGHFALVRQNTNI